MKKCECCGEVYSLDLFRKLDFVGIIDTGKYADFDLEMRNCSCKSSITIKVDKEGESGSVSSFN